VTGLSCRLCATIGAYRLAMPEVYRVSDRNNKIRLYCYKKKRKSNEDLIDEFDRVFKFHLRPTVAYQIRYEQ
jgi:hypothetical protein